MKRESYKSANAANKARRRQPPMKPKPPSWDPVLRGNYYCAPASKIMKVRRKK